MSESIRARVESAGTRAPSFFFKSTGRGHGPPASPRPMRRWTAGPIQISDRARKRRGFCRGGDPPSPPRGVCVRKKLNDRVRFFRSPAPSPLTLAPVASPRRPASEASWLNARRVGDMGGVWECCVYEPAGGGRAPQTLEWRERERKIMLLSLSPIDARLGLPLSATQRTARAHASKHKEGTQPRPSRQPVPQQGQ